MPASLEEEFYFKRGLLTFKEIRGLRLPISGDSISGDGCRWLE